MKKQPLISILMPVYNAGFFVSEAIESINSQTYKNWELVCVDDGSNDDSLIILKKYARLDKRIKILKNRVNKGISYSLNRAIAIAKGEYLCRMDADDISLPNRLEKQMEFLKKNPKVVACGGQVEMIDNKGKLIGRKYFPVDSKGCYKMIFKMVPIQHAALMIRANIMKKYRYLEDVSTSEDVDLIFYLISKGQINNTKDFIYQYRKADSSNGYHNVKKTFYFTLLSRIKAIKKYGYRPTLSGVMFSFLQAIVVTLLPSKLVVRLFEALRFQGVSGKEFPLFSVRVALELL